VREQGRSRLAAFFIHRTTAAFTVSKYPLCHSAILDSGANIHIFNEISRFLRFRVAAPGDFLWAGDTKVRIEGYGDVDIRVRSPQGRTLMRLYNVAYCSNFACNIVSYRKLKLQGLWWNDKPPKNHLETRDGVTVAYVQDIHDQSVLEYIPQEMNRATMYARRNKFNSYTRRPPSKAVSEIWHLRLGHAGQHAINHLCHASKGVKIKGLTTVECDS
jgi:hypothetical protein